MTCSQLDAPLALGLANHHNLGERNKRWQAFHERLKLQSPNHSVDHRMFLPYQRVDSLCHSNDSGRPSASIPEPSQSRASPRLASPDRLGLPFCAPAPLAFPSYCARSARAKQQRHQCHDHHHQYPGERGLAAPAVHCRGLAFSIPSHSRRSQKVSSKS